MNQSKDPKVQDWLTQMMMTDADKYPIVEALRDKVFEHYPSTREKMMYGGIIFSSAEDWGGIFAYKNHVSFEFSLGYQFNDPDNLLEGGGKYRRHLKFKSMEDVATKKVIYFVEQAIKN